MLWNFRKVFGIILNIVLVLTLSACQYRLTTYEQRYQDIVSLIKEANEIKSSSDFYDISGYIKQINGEYHYFIFIDNPKVSMYDVEVVAYLEGEDTEKNMANSISILDDKVYNMIPNVYKIEDGYIKGISLSKVIDVSYGNALVFVEWKHGDGSTTSHEIIKVELFIQE